MKKIMLFASALAGLFLAASCQQENLEPVMSGNTVTYTVQVPEALATKTTIGNEVSNVNKLHYEVYRTSLANTTNFSDVDRLLYHKTADVTNGKATIEVELVNDQNFTVLFWAQVEKDGFNSPYVVTDLTNVRIKTDSELSLGKAHKANQVDYAAFTGVDFIKSTDKLASKTVELTRPVAQLNIGTTDESLDAFKTRIEVEGSSVSVSGLSKTFDVANQAASGEYTASYNYTETAAPSEPLVVNGKEYKYVGMNYVGFADEVDNTLITVSYVINTTEGNIDNEIVNVPVKPNYRTNIVGNLITSKTGYVITLDKTWGDPAEVVNLWDGTTMTAPQVNANGDYEIAEPSELAWLAAAVNGTLPDDTKASPAPQDFAGKTFVLTKDIDLNNQSWTPIGTTTAFKGTFNGQNKTVRNLVVNGGNESNKGLFGYTTDGEIKNLTVENAKVSGRLNVGVVAGQPYTSKYTNITVTGHVEVNGMAYVGAVGGKNAYADWTNITVNVDETSYVKANSVENGTAYRTYVGGVVGFNGEGGHSFTDITSNINVEGSTCDVGGLFGIAHYGNQFENCVCTGDVTITTDEVENALEMGGIAGVWNNGGQDVVFTNCTFEGELLTPNITEEFDFYYGGLIGNPYSPDGKGKLIIDGATCVHDAASLKAALEANTENIVVGANIQTTEGFTATGENITLNLGGYTISGTDNSTGSFGLITNKGKLTVKGLGSMTLTATNDREWNAYSSVISNSVGGNLTVDGGVVIEHFGGTAMAYGIDNLTNGKGTSAVTTIKNATVKSVYRAVRQFLNGVEATNELYVEAGAIIESVAKEDGSRNKSIWMQDPSANANTGKLVVAEGAQLKGDVYLYVCAGSTEWPVEVSIANAAFAEGSTVITGNVPAGVAVENVDGIWTLVKTYEEIKEGDKVTGYKVKSADGLRAIVEKIEENLSLNIVLDADIDLSDSNWTPIGDNRVEDAAFSGTFDGNGHTIKGAHITGDHCFNGAVFGSKEGWGLFSVTDGATIKNLKVDGATFGSYTVISGTIAGYANNTTFENIEISNTKIAGYNWYTGGVVGWASGECTFKGVNLDETVAVGTLWDSHGQSAGGIAGGVSASAKITIEDCNIACVLDVINDVTSNYKWYIYRVAGMIIGNTNTTETKYNEVVTATATNVTCKNVTVTYGKWMNYHYCEGFWNRGWGRYESSDYIGGVDQNEPHNHAEGEEHCVCIPFDQLFGGSANGSGHYPVKGLAEFPGVTVVYPAEYTCPVCGEQHNVVAAVEE